MTRGDFGGASATGSFDSCFPNANERRLGKLVLLAILEILYYEVPAKLDQ